MAFPSYKSLVRGKGSFKRKFYELLKEIYDTFDDYVSESDLSTALEDYAEESALDDYVEESALTTTLSDYLITSRIEAVEITIAAEVDNGESAADEDYADAIILGIGARDVATPVKKVEVTVENKIKVTLMSANEVAVTGTVSVVILMPVPAE